MQFLRWVGTAASIIGALCVAFKFYIIGYLLFIIGASFWAIVGKKVNDNSLLLLNSVFLIINILGLYNATN